MPGTNTLAYYVKSYLATVKSFITLAPDGKLGPRVGVLAAFSGQPKVAHLSLQPLVQHDVPGGLGPMLHFFSPLLTNGPNKLDHLSLVSLSSLV